MKVWGELCRDVAEACLALAAIWVALALCFGVLGEYFRE